MPTKAKTADKQPQPDVAALQKENKVLARKLKETEYLVSSYEQYAVFQKSVYESIKKQKSEQDTYLRLIFGNTTDVILVLDVNLMYVMGTKNSMRALGINTDALTGQDVSAVFLQIMPVDWVGALTSDLRVVLSTGVNKRFGKLVATLHGGEYYFETSIIPIKDDKTGGVIGVILTMHDETILHEAVLSAERSNKAKTNFLAKISHEIRTPMNAIAGMAELILREQISGLVREHALSIRQASGNLMAIINDILDFSKIESGKLEIVETEYQFASLINDVISIIRMRVIDKQIFFTTNIDCDIPGRMIGDEIRLRQILLNLLSNAFKYCDRGFISIHASCEEAGNGAATMVFDISDSGIGIKPEDRGKLFSDFVQLDKVAHREVEGTGLGLVITKSLCEAMGGSIEVYSVYGEGSTFTVRIPQKVVSAERFARVEDPGSKNVLIYETRLPYSSSIICSIDNLGVGCTLVSNQSRFLEELNKNNYTHVFVSSFLFESTEKIVKNLGIDTLVVLLAEYGESAVNTDGVKTLEMPVHSISIANLLNGATDAAYAENPQATPFMAPSARILIVDDLMTNLRVAEGLMLPYKMQIDVCQSGAEAIELVKGKAYDIVFMDHMMPEMDGIEAAAKIRCLDGGEYKNLPVVALTANAVSGVKEMFLRNGFNDFLAKPIEMMKLHAILDTWLPKDKKEPYTADEKDESAPAFEIAGIDVRTGVQLTGGNERNYLRALMAFYKDGVDKLSQLNESFERGDTKAYAACAHAVKGAGASVGAVKLSSFAKALELAAKNENLNYIKMNHETFMDEFKALLGNIRYVVTPEAKPESGGAAPDTEFLKERLKKLRDALVEFDIEAADGALSELLAEPLDAATGEMLERVSNKILICEYDQALVIVEGMLGEN
jgi:signal transduction histidine kinase/HPt (histidine-containing phosphotransfer) domain-containing protein/FixJ family two-component response regulator